MRRVVQIGLAIVVLGAGGVGAWALLEFGPVSEPEDPKVASPLVRVQPVAVQPEQLTVETNGTVAPRTEIPLISEVSGKVIWVSPSLWPGGYFDEGEELFRLDRRDLRARLARAKAELARAEVTSSREQAQADLARAEWAKLEPDKEAPPLALRQPQLEEAKAMVAAAKADIEKAELDLERTVVTAPFTGRVRAKSVDVGQYITVGTPVAEIYAVDFAEVRLPIPDEDLAFLDLPMSSVATAEEGSRVVLTARFAGQDHEWEGFIARVEGEIDTRTRMVHAVARVANPYGRDESTPSVPLAAGMFVRAEIYGRQIEQVASVPRGAMRLGDQVLVVEVEARKGAEKRVGTGKLRLRDVEVLRRERDRTLVSAGLKEGEYVCVSPLAVVTEGMAVRFVEAPAKVETPPEAPSGLPEEPLTQEPGK